MTRQSIQDDLIYDLGLHKGEDTDFYLRKGFRVVSVEANQALAAACAQRFADDVAAGRLTVVPKAISRTPGVIDFYVNDHVSEWGTADPEWAERNDKRGATSQKIQVQAVTLGDLIEAHGVPYYMKIDIEGFDRLCLEQLHELGMKPRHVSVESSATSMSETFGLLDLLERMGFTRFKIVPQHDIRHQVCPSPAREGSYVDYAFSSGSSGLFGNEAPGAWSDLASVRKKYRRIYFDYAMVGTHHGILRRLRRWPLRPILDKVFHHGRSWYDTHATW